MSNSPVIDHCVLAAAKRLVKLYGANMMQEYLALFAPDATFIFYSYDDVMMSLNAWSEEIARLEADGNRVLSCTSSNQHVQTIAPNGALFFHDVTTVEADAQGNETTYHERETIVFQFRGGDGPMDGHWLAVHEHLSPIPESATV